MPTKIGALTNIRLVSEIVTGITRQPRQVGRICSAFLLFGVTASLLAACGSAAGSSASGSSTPGSFSAYLSCLSQHGVTVPSSRPTASPRPGGFGGFGGSGSSADQAARKACASLRPSFGGPGGPGGPGGRGGGGFGGFASALASFRSCMSKHGEPIPTTRPTSTPAPSASPADRFLNGLNPGNAKVAAALKACQSKLPSFFRSPSS
jgi:hypothetical protein